MSHLLLHEHITPVPTEHGDIHITTGRTRYGDERIVIVTPGTDDTDLHLTADQALLLAQVVETFAQRRKALS